MGTGVEYVPAVHGFGLIGGVESALFTAAAHGLFGVSGFER